MKPMYFLLSGLILACSSVTTPTENRTRLHLAGDFQGKVWFAELITQDSATKLEAQLCDGSWQGTFTGKADKQELVFKASNEKIFSGTISTPLPLATEKSLSAVWTSATSQRPIANRIIARERVVRSLKKSEYEASYAWPEVTGYGKLANSLLTTTVSNFALSNHLDFLKLSENTNKRGKSAFLWEHHISYETKLISDRFFSLRFYCYSDIGGAHPAYCSRSWNFAISGTSAHPIPFASIVRPGQLKPLVSLVQKILADKKASSPHEVQSNHLENYVLTPRGIEFYFDRYIAGSYAEGEYTVFMKWDDLKEYITLKIK